MDVFTYPSRLVSLKGYTSSGQASTITVQAVARLVLPSHAVRRPSISATAQILCVFRLSAVPMGR